MTDLLDWANDENSRFGDNDGALVASHAHRSYHIWPIHGSDDEVLGYRDVVGDMESDDSSLGSVEIEGEPGELTLPEAKACADTEAASRLDEQQLALITVLNC